MTTVYATFDGQVLRPEEPISLPPNTRVRLLLEPAGPESAAEDSETGGFPFFSRVGCVWERRPGVNSLMVPSHRRPLPSAELL